MVLFCFRSRISGGKNLNGQQEETKIAGGFHFYVLYLLADSGCKGKKFTNYLPGCSLSLTLLLFLGAWSLSLLLSFSLLLLFPCF